MDWMWEMKEKEVATMPTGFMLVKQYGGWCHSGLYETPEENWGGEKIIRSVFKMSSVRCF